MIHLKAKWEKLGQIAKPDSSIFWMSTFTGPSFAVQNGQSSFFDIFITGRDEKNRSIIGKSTLDLENIEKGLNIHPNPIFTPGELGAFDENGVSYPVIVEHEGRRFMYFVGWMPSVLTPFLNFTGLAIASIGSDEFKRHSRAPILERTNEEPFSSGSVYVMKDEGQWKMWYTSFLRWGQPGEHKHYYVIKCAFSKDGINWERPGSICINIEDQGEYAIGKPSVVKHKGIYHMWYVYRGLEYRIGYAHSTDGINFTRADHLVGIDVSPDGGWDGRAISYPHVFRYKDYLYMLYCGNEYGREGLGIARLYLPE
jgi:predicted GH43/DUF377 family glycosyl hydrolase